MGERLSNFILPITGGAVGGTTPLWLGWHTMGDTALTAAIMAFVGGIIGILVKLGFDEIKKKLF